VVLTGVPGSGKSTIAKNKFSTYRRINLDTLGSRSKEDAEILKGMEESADLIIDNTNTTARARKRYIDIAKAFGIPIRSIYVKCPIEVAMKRNHRRVGKQGVPDHVVRFYLNKLEVPSIEEGFESCLVIEIAAERE
jgi:predicted kinase